MVDFSVSATLSEMLNGELRLDATYYTSVVYQARKTLENYKVVGGKITNIGAFSSGAFNPPPIKRIYTDDQLAGTPYMLPQEMFDFYWAPKKYVLADRMHDIDNWFLKAGWIVLTQSGSVGKPYYVTSADETVVLSQNAIRIPASDVSRSGYIYAFLSTWIGQTLLKKDEFGITVKHIRPHHVDSIEIPDIDKKQQKIISDKVQKEFQLRAESIKLLDEAKKMVYSAIGAPESPPSDDQDADSDKEQIST